MCTRHVREISSRIQGLGHQPSIRDSLDGSRGRPVMNGMNGMSVDQLRGALAAPDYVQQVTGEGSARVWVPRAAASTGASTEAPTQTRPQRRVRAGETGELLVT